MALTVAAGAAVTGSLTTGECPVPAECGEDTVRTSLTGVWLGQGAVIVLAVLAVGGEYGSGTIRAALAAGPRRLRLLAAKALAVCALTLAAAVPAVAGALLAGRWLLASGGFPLPGLTDGPVLRAAAGSVLYLLLTALLALGAGAALRDTATAVTAVLAVFSLLPLLAGMVSDPQWQERELRAAPATPGWRSRPPPDWTGCRSRPGRAWACWPCGAPPP
ncbi:ABC transporter permease subunit [Streptomyces sp. YIM 98790]|uniref:ABC transporter permease subunit n=1 Tax=Streptomyces sp. YIM 98790 TaxID=2689077 RepID=UPI00140DC6C3|nr:ABC transporter permease subunit [Streptomyces sp. YIM 98790]